MDNGCQISEHIALLSRYNQASMARRLKSLGIGSGQFPLLLCVCEHPGIPQDSLTARMGCNKSSVARGVAALEKLGFLRRETAPEDRRAYRLHPTEAGFEARTFVRRQLEEHIDELTAELSEDERRQFAALLERLVAATADRRQSGKEPPTP